MDILGMHGGVTRASAPDADKYCYMTLTSPELERAISGRAPMTGVTITDAVDMQMAKTLSGDYVVASFGHKPVNIEISGLDIFGPCADSDSIAYAFSQINAGSNADARVRLSLSMDPGTVYVCVVSTITLNLDANSGQTTGDGVGRYRMSLVGVRT